MRAGSSQIVSQERALHLRIARQQAEWTRVQEQNEEINRSLQSEVANLEQWSDDVLQREEEETNEFHRLHAAAAGLAPTDNHPAEVRRLRRELQQLHREVQVGIQSQPRFSELGRLAALWTARDQAEIALAHSITAANFTERDLLPTTIDASAITQAELDARLEKTYRVGLLGIQLQAAQAASQAKRMEKVSRERRQLASSQHDQQRATFDKGAQGEVRERVLAKRGHSQTFAASLLVTTRRRSSSALVLIHSFLLLSLVRSRFPSLLSLTASVSRTCIV